MKILLNKTGEDFNLTWEAVDELEFELGWREDELKDFVGLFYPPCIELRSNPEMIEIIERMGEKAFLKSSSQGHYEIVELDISEEEAITDYFIYNLRNHESILKKTNPKTVSKILGGVDERNNRR